MKFVFVSYNYSPGFTSPQQWIKRIVAYTGSLEYLAKTHQVIRIEQINYSGNYLHNGVEYYFTRFAKSGMHLPWKLNQFVKNLEPDIVLIHGTHYPLEVMQLRLILNKKTRVIVQHHAEQPFKGMKKYLQRLTDKYIDAYLFASRALGMEWVNSGNLASPQKIHEVMEVSSIFYPINKTVAKTKTKVNGQPVFLWVGRLNENKDPLNVVKAFLRYSGQNPSAMLYMIYHTNELLPEINSLLEDHPNRNSVTLIGELLHEELLYWYNSADFILSGSYYEGGGTAVCEAMSCGCIPIVTDIFSFRMITDEGKCGILYEAGNEEELFDSLMQTNQMDMQKKRDECLEYFQTNLSFQAIAQRIQAIAASLY